MAPRPAHDDPRSAAVGPVGVGQSRKALRRARKKQRGRRRAKRILLTAILVVVMLIGGTAGYSYHLFHEVHQISVRGLVAIPSSGADVNTENILMVGSTTRCGLAQQNPAYGLCSQGVTGVNSDVIMILHLNPPGHAVSILSIPRDLFVPNARTHGANKIDAALYDGPGQLVSVIENDFGIPIQHYVELNFDTFANVVNALGGVDMYFPMPVFDAYSGLYQPTTGCVHLDGIRALQVVRARHLQYKAPGVTTSDPHYWPQEVQSDLARIRRDHEFLRVLAAAVAKNGLSNPITDAQIINGVAPQLMTTLSSGDMIRLVLAFHSVDAATAPQYTLPVQVGTFGTYYYKGGDYGDVEFPATGPDQQTIDQFLGVGPGTNTMTGAPLPSPSSVAVSVVNGTGVYNQAADTARALSALGFQASDGGNATPVGTEAETIVDYGDLTPSTEAAAEAVAQSITGAVIMAYDPQAVTTGAQVTVTTGSQFAVNPPAAAPTSTTTPGLATGGTSGSGAPATSTAGFAPPSPAVTSLQPWDPRACTASGGEGA